MADNREAERRRQEVSISQIEVTAFCHATENCSHVEESIRNLFPRELRTSIKINRVLEHGYYGNPIYILSVKVSDKHLIASTVSYLASKLESLEKTLLRSTFDLRYDPRTSRFVVRFSKQDLYLGYLKVTDSDDVVKLVLYLKNAKRKTNAFSFLEGIGLIA